MSEAQYWRDLCAARLPAGASLVDDPWSRAMMADVAVRTDATGFSGRLWTFTDGSKLIANPDVVLVK